VSAISTHVLDIAAGRPAAGLRVRLERVAAAGQQIAPAGEEIAAASTDVDGRIASLGPEVIAAGIYRLVFHTAGYLAGQHGGSGSDSGTGPAAFFPEVTVTFTVAEGEHYHVPLLLSPFGYSIYRGS
jgi:5-hydroxyisourate hydrolase